jgi:hypothetical protein
LTSPP